MLRRGYRIHKVQFSANITEPPKRYIENKFSFIVSVN